MLIGINVTAAVKQPRTGVEEYTYQLIKHLTMLPEAREHRFLLYLPAPKSDADIRIHANDTNKYFDFDLPQNFEIKILKWPLSVLWTQIRLAWEMLRRPPEILLIPVHILPFFHPKNSVVTIHGLEYEYFPKYYPWRHRLYLRWSTKYALKHTRKIIAISENTKRDLIKLYGGKRSKIEMVHHGIEIQKSKIKSQNDFGHSEAVGRGISHECGINISRIRERFLASLGMTGKKPYLLYLGRSEQKKNIEGILEAYKILKEKYQIPHQLVLAGSPGFGYDNLKLKVRHLLEIKELGYIDEDTKWRLFRDTDVFLFPSFYEGFGLPILEAQATRAPIVTSDNSCLREIAGEGALFVNPKDPAQIAEAVKSIIDDNALRDRLVAAGSENLKRFGWEKCARETLKILADLS